MMKNFFKALIVFTVLMMVVVLATGCISPKKVELKTGWQKIQISGIVPKGAIVIIDEGANGVLPGDGETKRRDGFIHQGKVIFFDSMFMITETPVWAYYPDEYEFIVKLDDFSDECLAKLSDLTGEEEKNMSEYFIGHP